MAVEMASAPKPEPVHFRQPPRHVYTSGTWQAPPLENPFDASWFGLRNLPGDITEVTPRLRYPTEGERDSAAIDAAATVESEAVQQRDELDEVRRLRQLLDEAKAVDVEAARLVAREQELKDLRDAIYRQVPAPEDLNAQLDKIDGEREDIGRRRIRNTERVGALESLIAAARQPARAAKERVLRNAWAEAVKDLVSGMVELPKEQGDTLTFNELVSRMTTIKRTIELLGNREDFVSRLIGGL